MSMRLKSVECVDHPGRLRATYELTHSNNTTTLALDVVLTVDKTNLHGFHAAMDITGPTAGTPDEALDRLADWLERSAGALRNRKTGDDVSCSLPLYDF